MAIEKVLTLGTSGIVEKEITTGDAPSAVGIKQTISLTAGQTTVPVPGGYTAAGVLVFLNGSYITPAEYAATDLVNIELSVGAPSNDSVLDVIVFTIALSVPNVGDVVTRLNQTEVSIAGATILTNTAFGFFHECSGTSANYTVTLPPVSGNAGKFIGFRMAAGLTKLVTIGGSGSEEIDSSANVVFWANEVAVFLCTGSAWVKTSGKKLAMICEMYPITELSVANGSNTKVPVEATVKDNTGLMADPTTNKRINIPRTGLWRVQGIVYYKPGTQVMTSNHCRLHVNGTLAPLGVGIHSADVPAAKADFNQHTAVLQLNAGDYLELYAYQVSAPAASRDIYVNNTAFSYIAVQEMVSG